MKQRVPYGVGSFDAIRTQNMYYVDKTWTIELLEQHQYAFFIRPRRFGKSLLVSTLEAYYDRAKADLFDALFGGLWVHSHPTSEKHAYLVLRLDFSGIETSGGKQMLYETFNEKTKEDILSFLKKYGKCFEHSIEEEIQRETSPAMLIKRVCNHVQDYHHKIYLLIDEYDNFANDLIGHRQDELYYDILSKTGFVRTFYEAIKEGAQRGAIARLFMTGVSPIMLDDMTSGFNIASNITLDLELNESLGFTQSEVETILEYYTTSSQDEQKRVLEDMHTHYNGYLFHKDATERMYNPDMVFYFMKYYEKGRYPEEWIDMNVQTDYGKIQRLAQEDRFSSKESILEEVLEKERVITKLVQKFPLEAISHRDSFLSLLFYMGMLTIEAPVMANVQLKIPNLVVRGMYWEALYRKINESLPGRVDIGAITQVTECMAKNGDPTAFIEYAYDKFLQYRSNRDTIGLEEKHIKVLFLTFLSMNPVYIPYSELEMSGGYCDIALIPDRRYGLKYSQLWELKVVKSKEDAAVKLQEATDQICRYEKDAHFQRMVQGTTLRKYVILAFKDRAEVHPS